MEWARARDVTGNQAVPKENKQKRIFLKKERDQAVPRTPRPPLAGLRSGESRNGLPF